MKKIILIVILFFKFSFTVNSQTIIIEEPYIYCYVSLSYSEKILNVETYVYNRSNESIFFVKSFFDFYYYQRSIYHSGILSINFGWGDKETFLTLQELKSHDTIRFNNAIKIDTNLISLNFTLAFLPQKKVRKKWIENGLFYLDYYCNTKRLSYTFSDIYLIDRSK